MTKRQKNNSQSRHPSLPENKYLRITPIVLGFGKVILYILIPKVDRNNIIGDLREEYRSALIKWGNKRANKWLCRQIIISLLYMLPKRLKLVHAWVWCKSVLGSFKQSPAHIFFTGRATMAFPHFYLTCSLILLASVMIVTLVLSLRHTDLLLPEYAENQSDRLLEERANSNSERDKSEASQTPGSKPQSDQPAKQVKARNGSEPDKPPQLPSVAFVLQESIIIRSPSEPAKTEDQVLILPCSQMILSLTLPEAGKKGLYMVSLEDEYGRPLSKKARFMNRNGKLLKGILDTRNISGRRCRMSISWNDEVPIYCQVVIRSNKRS